MKKCMVTDKPLVSILLAVYKPNTQWLIEQLVSLNNQTYENIELLVYDDCPSFPVDELLIKKHISKFSYTLIRGIKNQGSNKAFEYLTQKACGDLFAYCDQDDIWENEKVKLMVQKFISTNHINENNEKVNEENFRYNNDITLVYSDLSIINKDSKKIANSLTKIRKRIVYRSGYNLAETLLMTNFVTGCAMMVRRDIARKAIPFESTVIHDQWIAIIAAIEGKIEFINKPLVRYRQHNFNQTGILTGVYDKQTYYEMRIEGFSKRYENLKKRLSWHYKLNQNINDSLVWLEARKKYANRKSLRDLKIMMKYREFHKVSILLETFLPFIPNSIFKYIIKLTKKGIL